MAIVLAAGHARRFGADKLAASFRGKPLVAHAINAARAAPVERILLVTRAHVADLPGGTDVKEVLVDSHEMAQSLQAGIAAAGDVTGAFVFLGDMPLVPHDMAARLADGIGDGFAALPRCSGRPGHPVLLSRRAFTDVAGLQGDAGAGRLLRGRGDVVHIDTDDRGVIADIDTPADLASLGASGRTQ